MRFVNPLNVVATSKYHMDGWESKIGWEGYREVGNGLFWCRMVVEALQVEERWCFYGGTLEGGDWNSPGGVLNNKQPQPHSSSSSKRYAEKSIYLSTDTRYFGMLFFLEQPFTYLELAKNGRNLSIHTRFTIILVTTTATTNYDTPPRRMSYWNDGTRRFLSHYRGWKLSVPDKRSSKVRFDNKTTIYLFTLKYYHKKR